MFLSILRCFLYASVLLITLGSLAQALDFNVLCRPSLVEVGAGEDAALSCSLEPGFNVSDQTIKWSLHWKTDTMTEKMNVHAIHNGVDPGKTWQQHKHFINRTRLDRDGLKDGNIGLNIFNVSKKDEGNYTCEVIVTKDDASVYTREGTVTLSVKPAIGGRIAPPNTTATPRDDTPSKVAVGVGVGVVVAVSALIGLIALIIWLKRRREGAAAENQTNIPLPTIAEQQPLRDGDAENPRAL